MVSSADEDSRTALHYAADNGSPEIVEGLLANNKTDPNAQDYAEQAPLHCASHKGHSQVVNILLQHPQVDATLPDGEGRQPLHDACEKGHLKIVNLLLQHDGVEVSCTDQGEYTPLHLACSNGHADVAERLLQVCSVFCFTLNRVDLRRTKKLALLSAKRLVQFLPSLLFFQFSVFFQGPSLGNTVFITAGSNIF